MEYRKLGESGLVVSPLCLGTMMFGNQTGESEAGRIVESAFNSGVNFIDTADQYAFGESERITGKLIAPHRSHWVLATKVGNQFGEGPNRSGLGRRWVMQQCEASLKRLGTDYVDIYYLHIDDQQTPLEETVSVVGNLITQGKVRYFGISNFRGWRIALLVAVCQQLGVPRPVVCQPYYNAMNRMPEVEILPACAHFGIGIVPYSPLARGVLTGKYMPGEAPPPDTRAGRKDPRMMETEFRDESLRIAQDLMVYVQHRGMSLVDFALNWVLNNSLVHSVIAGPRTLEQWTDYLGALGRTLNAADEEYLDRLVPPGHPSTPGYSDPRYPFHGRIAKTT